jgi:hydroxyethylthiazole kinase-like uncharacterized protein yjeF
MKIFQCKKIKELDQYTIEHEPIRSIDLMERSAEALYKAIASRWTVDVPFIIFAGPGNNGGDALALSRLLIGAGYNVQTYLFNPENKLSEDCTTNRDRLAGIPSVLFTEVTKQFVPPAITENHIVIDGLFGSGLDKPLSGGYAGLVKYINASPAKIVSIDIPSGLNGDGNRFDVYPNIIVKASLTLSLQFPKVAFFFAENQDCIGEVQTLDIGLSQEGIDKTDSIFTLLEEGDVKSLIKSRPKFSHKGDYGHALLIAGSYGMAGAAIMGAKACLRSGVGLLTVHTPSLNLPMVQVAVPEAIVQPDENEYVFTNSVFCSDYQAMGIGPGLRQKEETASALIDQLSVCDIPLVLDADALNILSERKDKLTAVPYGSILTPHPKELERLTSVCVNSYERLMKAIELSASLKSFIILKGAFSVIVCPDGSCYFNTTGNPGMATAGSGDVLTGIVLSLLAQDYDPKSAAILATYVHGLAGDIAAREYGEIGMTAMNIVDSLPQAWKQLINQ